MVKIHTTISIDEYVLKKAKEKGLVISSVCEMALREKSGQTLTAEDKQCFLCESKEDLMWKWPEEFWICPKCDNEESKVFTARICCAKG